MIYRNVRSYDPPMRVRTGDASANHVGELQAGTLRPVKEDNEDLDIAEAFDGDVRSLRRVVRRVGDYDLYWAKRPPGEGYGPAAGLPARDAALLSNLEQQDPRDDCARVGALRRLLAGHYRRF
jgi:hypothetical protein